MSILGCICVGTNPRYLSIDCPNVDSHDAWAAREGKPVMYPPGTFHVEPRCVCRGNARYYSVRCADVANHINWVDLPWHTNPPFQESYMISAADYHKQVMAAVEAETGRGPGYWWSYKPPVEGVRSVSPSGAALGLASQDRPTAEYHPESATSERG